MSRTPARAEAAPDGRAADRRVFRALGRTIAVAGADGELDRLLRERLPAFGPAPSGAEPDRLYAVTAQGDELRVAVDSRRPGSARDRRATAERIVADLQVYLARHAQGKVLVHAGVIRFRGRAIVIPGRSFSGKSTLVAAFAAAGAAYASDELAVLDRLGRVHPYARPLALRGGGVVRRVAPDALAGGVVRSAAPVGLLLLPRYRPGGRWTPVELTPAQAMLELMRHTLAVRSRPAEVLAVLRATVENARALAGVRGEAAEVVTAVLATLGRDAGGERQGG